jgi:hypothetical protein
MPINRDDPHPSDEEDVRELEELGNPVPGYGLIQNFEPYQYTMTMGKDGLPMEQSPPWQSQDAAPIPLTPETVHCLPQPQGQFTPRGLPACSHYKRQRCHNPQAPDRPIIMRFCTHPSLRGINGASLAIDDAGIFECEFRDPPDPKSTVLLDCLDHQKIVLGRERLRHEKAMGRVHGFRLFRTPEDVEAGRYVLDDSEQTESELTKIDPFAPDKE